MKNCAHFAEGWSEVAGDKGDKMRDGKTATMTLILHYAPDNASLCVRLALERAGLSYTTRLVDRRAKAQKSESYLALNPNGLIPVLESPDGPLFETAAILLWIADHSGERLTAQERTWLIWLANTLHPALRMTFYPENYLPDAPELIRAATQDRLPQLLTILDEADSATFLDADALSLAGCYLAPLLRWSALYGGDTHWFDLSRTPRLAAFARMADDDPIALRAAKAEGLGRTPFSEPHPPNPPEGVAL